MRSLVNAVSSALPKPNAKPAPEAVPQVEEITPTADVPDNSGSGSQNVIRDSLRFTPESNGKAPFLLGSGGPGVDTGISGWGSALKKLGLGGGGADTATAQSSQVLHQIGRTRLESVRFASAGQGGLCFLRLR